MLPKDVKLNVQSMDEVRLVHGDITVLVVNVNTSDVVNHSSLADKAEFIVRTDITMNEGLLVNRSFNMFHCGENYKVKVQEDRDNGCYIIDVIKPAQRVGMRTVSLPGVKATNGGAKKSRKYPDTRPGDAFPAPNNY